MGFLHSGGRPAGRRAAWVSSLLFPAPVLLRPRVRWCRRWLLCATARKGWHWPHKHALAGWAAARMTVLRLNAYRRLAVVKCLRS